MPVRTILAILLLLPFSLAQCRLSDPGSDTDPCCNLPFNHFIELYQPSYNKCTRRTCEFCLDILGSETNGATNQAEVDAEAAYYNANNCWNRIVTKDPGGLEWFIPKRYDIAQALVCFSMCNITTFGYTPAEEEEMCREPSSAAGWAGVTVSEWIAFAVGVGITAVIALLLCKRKKRDDSDDEESSDEERENHRKGSAVQLTRKDAGEEA